MYIFYDDNNNKEKLQSKKQKGFTGWQREVPGAVWGENGALQRRRGPKEKGPDKLSGGVYGIHTSLRINLELKCITSVFLAYRFLPISALAKILFHKILYWLISLFSTISKTMEDTKEAQFHVHTVDTFMNTIQLGSNRGTKIIQTSRLH